MELRLLFSDAARASRPVAALLLGIAALVRPCTAYAQRGVQLVPDATQRLVSKDVGDERWAISLDVESGIVTGNVYRKDGGDPQYVWCVPADASRDPMRLRCHGTSGCDEWVDLGEVELPASFFGPSACETAGTAAAADDAGPHAASGTTDGGGARASGLRLTPDGSRSLIAKDVGGLRWTMSFDHVARTMTGNVFDPGGGAPQFVSCRFVTGTAEATFACVGAAACACGACRQADWTPLPDVTLPTSFYEARRCPAKGIPAGLVTTLRPSAPVDAVDEELLNQAFGAQVAIAGDVVATGSREKAVYIYERSADGWREAARIPPLETYGGPPYTARFATWVGVSGSRVAISDNGAIRIVERGDGTWSQVSTIVPPVDGERFGSTALAGDTLVVSTTSADPTRREQIHVYQATGGTWAHSATVPLPGRSVYERLGGVDLIEDRLAVLVLGGDSASLDSLVRASIDVLERRAGEWRVVSSAPIPYWPLESSLPAFALAGEELVVGDAPREPLRRTRGHVRWYAGPGQTWRETQEFAACSSEIGRFGRVLAVSGDTLIVGAPSYPRGGAAGEVHVFRRDRGGWTAQGRLRVGDAAPDGMALDGRTLVVGSTQQSSSTGGALQVFDLEAVELLPPVPCTAEPEVWPGDDWRVASPTEHGMNPRVLARAGEEALRPGSNTQGVVVARHGVIVAEWYEDGRDATSYGASWSVAKSVAGALIGVAIERGDLPDEGVSLARFYPQWEGTAKAEITLRHALQMTSGLEFGENHATRPGNVSDIAYLASMARDHLAYVLERPLIHPPGSEWHYSSGDSMLLSGVIEAATGLSAGEYARRHLFEPLDMPRAQWWTDAVGHTLTYCCFDAPSRDFARIGLLYARNGRWNGRQVLPERWVRDSTASVGNSDGGSYGYQWYPGSSEMYAFGFDDQWIYVFPDLDLVVVRNGHYDKDPGPPVADPNLFARYPAGGLVPGHGTVPPENWSMGPTLKLILESIVGR